MTSDGEDSDVKPPAAQKQKQNAKKSKTNDKWQRQYMQTQNIFNFQKCTGSLSREPRTS